MGSRATGSSGERRCSPAPFHTRPLASTWPWWIPESARPGTPWRCARQPRTGSWSAPTTGCSGPRSSASAAPWRPPTSPCPTCAWSLLYPTIETLGGAVAAADVTLSSFRLDPVSATFHGRDVFAPVAAHLARGASLSEAGERIDAESLIRIEAPEPAIEAGHIRARVVSVDRFGNSALDLAEGHLPRSGLRMGRPVAVDVAGSTRDAIFALTFADVPDGGLLLYEDSTGSLALAVNRGDAAAELGLEPGAEITLRPAD